MDYSAYERGYCSAQMQIYMDAFEAWHDLQEPGESGLDLSEFLSGYEAGERDLEIWGESDLDASHE